MLELFILETCPYSRKVMDFMKSNEIDYKKHDIAEPENYEELNKIGGRIQVPFLYNSENNEKLYESDDIIDYVKKLK